MGAEHTQAVHSNQLPPTSFKALDTLTFATTATQIAALVPTLRQCRVTAYSCQPTATAAATGATAAAAAAAEASSGASLGGVLRQVWREAAEVLLREDLGVISVSMLPKDDALRVVTAAPPSGPAGAAAAPQLAPTLGKLGLHLNGQSFTQQQPLDSRLASIAAVLKQKVATRSGTVRGAGGAVPLSELERPLLDSQGQEEGQGDERGEEGGKDEGVVDTLELGVGGMSCATCARSIEGALNQVRRRMGCLSVSAHTFSSM